VYASATPVASTPYVIEGWAKPVRMKSDGDVSPIIRWAASHPINKIVGSANITHQVVQGYAGPTAANERDLDGRIIIARAKLIYGEVEGALEIYQGASAEYEDLLTELQSVALPGQDSDWMAQGDQFDSISPFVCSP
jgi:hypothetical protein